MSLISLNEDVQYRKLLFPLNKNSLLKGYMISEKGVEIEELFNTKGKKAKAFKHCIFKLCL